MQNYTAELIKRYCAEILNVQVINIMELIIIDASTFASDFFRTSDKLVISLRGVGRGQGTCFCDVKRGASVP